MLSIALSTASSQPPAFCSPTTTSRLGHYDPERRSYQEKTLDEPLDLLSLGGTITSGEDGEPIAHAKVIVNRREYTNLGDLLVEATIGPTQEVVVETMPLTIRRRYDSDMGLMLWDLSAVDTVSM